MPLQQCAVDENMALRIPATMGHHGLALSRALFCLEGIMAEGSRQARADPFHVDFPSETLKEKINAQVATL